MRETVKKSNSVLSYGSTYCCQQVVWPVAKLTSWVRGEEEEVEQGQEG